MLYFVTNRNTAAGGFAANYASLNASGGTTLYSLYPAMVQQRVPPNTEISYCQPCVLLVATAPHPPCLEAIAAHVASLMPQGKII